MKVSAVLAAYDERENLEILLPRLTAALGAFEAWEIVLVVEGADGSLDVVRKAAAAEPRIRFEWADRPSGLGNAFRRAFAAVAPDADVVVTLDADLNHQPEEIPRLVAALDRRNADVVIGSRFVTGSHVEGIPPWKRALSGAMNVVIRHLFGLDVLDKTSGFRAYRAPALRQIRFENPDFAFLPEMLVDAKRRGFAMVEEPIRFVYRRIGRSKMAIATTIASYVRMLLRRADGPYVLALASIVLAAAGALLYGPTLRLSFAYDDIDYLNQGADALAGKASFFSVLARPQGEHFVPLLRVLFVGSAWLFGPTATPFRLVVLASHVLSALGVGLVARRALGRDSALFSGGLAYLLPAGLASMWVWYPSGGCVPIGLAGLHAGVAALVLAPDERLSRARWAAAGGVVWMLLCESTLVPFVVTPALVDEWRRRRGGRLWRRPGALALFCAAIGLATVVAASSAFRSATGTSISVQPGPGLARAAFLVATAPFRYLFPGSHMPAALGDPTPSGRLLLAWGIALSFLLVAFLVAAVRTERSRALVLSFLLLPGPIAWVTLVGLGRWKVSLSELWDGDRYYFGFLAPFALLVAHAVARVGSTLRESGRATRAAMGLALGGWVLVECALHRTAMLRRVPFAIYDAHARRLEQLSDLARRVERETEVNGPVDFPDSAFFFRDVHNNRISSRLFLSVCDRQRSGRIRLAPEPVDAGAAARLDAVLAAWSSAEGADRPSFRIVGGFLRNMHESSRIDFRVQDVPEAVGDGFFPWEGSYRWTGDRGLLRLSYDGSPSLHLVLAVPVDSIRARRPDVDAVRVRVRLSFPGGVEPIDGGTLELRSSAIAEHVVTLPRSAKGITPGAAGLLALRVEPAWRPIDVLPGSGDARTLGVQVYAAWFE